MSNVQKRDSHTLSEDLCALLTMRRDKIEVVLTETLLRQMMINQMNELHAR